MGNTVQLKKNGQPVFPVTDVSLVMGLQDAIKLPPVKVTTLPTASAETAGKMYYVGPDANDEYERYITSATNGSYEWIDLGDTSIPLPSIADNLTTDDANTALSAKQGKVLNEEIGELEAKVTPFPYLLDGTIEANKRIKELYLTGLDNTKRYYFKILRYYSGGPYIQARIYSFTLADKSDEVEVARTPDAAPMKGIAQFSQRNSSGVSGYVVYNFDTTDTSNLTPEINIPVCSEQKLSPTIYAYLKKVATSDINDSAITTGKIANGAITTGKIADSAVTNPQIANKSVTAPKIDADIPFLSLVSTNLINPNDTNIVSGYYLDPASGLPERANANYTTSGYFPVVAGLDYVTNDDEVRYVSFYDENKSYLGQSAAIVGVKTTNFTAPQGAYYCRISLGGGHLLSGLLIERGITATDFIPFVNKKNDTNEVLATNPVSFSGIEMNGVISAGGSIKANRRLSTEKNCILVARVHGQITSIAFGVGSRNESPYYYYSAYFVQLTPTTLSVHWYNNIEVVTLHTFTHGITLDDITTICIQTSCNNVKQAQVILNNSSGGEFKKTIFWEGLGRMFFKNWGDSSLDVDCRFFSRDLTKPVWIFGDSYVTYSDNRRWTYYLVSRFITDWLLVHRPGADAEEMFNDFLVALYQGNTPSYLLWCLGMNGNPDVDSSTPDSTQKTYIDLVVSVCRANNIEPILMTIPSVPNIPHTAINNYIRSLGCRYIDVEEAVGADAEGNWTTGLLSNDNVHPTELGAKVICASVIAGFPEIAIAPATPYKDVTVSAPGLMTASDKSKLDGITINSSGVFTIGGHSFQLTEIV